MFGTTYLHNKILISIILFQKTHWFWPKNGVRIKTKLFKTINKSIFFIKYKMLKLVHIDNKI
jgi:hypothetical protein